MLRVKEQSLRFSEEAKQQQQQQSQQSFSQGVSSQPGIFSQLSQNSAHDFVINDQEKVQRINIQSDEETNQDFFCFHEDKETGTGIFSMQQAQEETERILRKARRRKRKHSNTIIIN